MSKQTILSPEQLEEIKKLCDMGHRHRFISKKLNIELDVVRQIVRKLDLPVGLNIQRKTVLSEEQLEQIKDLFNSGAECVDIATKLNIGTTIIKRVLEELNLSLDSRVYPRNKTILSEEKIQQIKDLYIPENGYYQICKKLNLTKTVMKRILKELNLPIYKREHPRNKTILSPEQLQQIKTLHAEGYRTKNISIKLNLSPGVVKRTLTELNLISDDNSLSTRNIALLEERMKLSEDQLKQIQYLFDEGYGRNRISEKMNILSSLVYNGMDQLNIVYHVQSRLPTQRECERCLITLPIANFRKRVFSSGRVEFNFKCFKCVKEIWKNKPHIIRLNDDLRHAISGSIRYALKNINSNKEYDYCLSFLTFTIRELKSHIEKQFEPWMNWNNHGQYIPNKWDENDPKTWKWQIDHIKPHSLFDYSSMEDQSFKDCWALSNLRPYSARQNCIDGGTRVRHILYSK